MFPCYHYVLRDLKMSEMMSNFMLVHLVTGLDFIESNQSLIIRNASPIYYMCNLVGIFLQNI